MSRDRSDSGQGLQSWNDPGQNRESGGAESESTPYAVDSDGVDVRSPKD
jgi:hypothetical protein